MSYSRDLPFERGATYFGDQTPDATVAVHLEGKRFLHPDTVNGRGPDVVLRVVRNVKGSAITVTQGLGYAAGTAKTGTEVDGAVDAISDISYIIDDAYPASFSIADDDLFYVVEEGVVQGLSGADWVANDKLAFNSSGKLVTASAGAKVVAIAREDATAADELKEVLAIVGGDAVPVSHGVTNTTASTLTVTKLLHSGRVVTINAAAGCAVTLPAAIGNGDVYRFFLGTTVTSNTTTIKVANASDVMAGTASIAQDSADTDSVFETASTSDTITFNGSTTGGIKGDFVELIDVAANLWFVRVTASGTGTEATPFSATV